MFIRHKIVLFVIFFIVTNNHAQLFKIKGRVVNDINNYPIADAQLLLSGYDLVTSSDKEGDFSFLVEKKKF